MNYLVTCSSDFGSCCSDYGIASVISISRNIVSLIQIIVPIILLVMVTFDLIMMMQNPEKKNGIKTLSNKFMAALVVFFIPMLVDVTLSMLPENVDIGECYRSAKTISFNTSNRTTYISVTDQKRKDLMGNPDDYEKGIKKPEGSDGTGSSGGGSSNAVGAGAQRIINVALGEIGNHESDRSHHKYEAYNGLDDSQPWCAAFVSWCAGQAGYLKQGLFPKFVGCTTGLRLFKTSTNAEVHLASSGYNPKPGDIVFFAWSGQTSGDSDHVGIVLSSDSKYVYTVEGNTSCSGEAASKCGGSDGVSKKSRPRNNTIYAYVTPKYTG